MYARAVVLSALLVGPLVAGNAAAWAKSRPAAHGKAGKRAAVKHGKATKGHKGGKGRRRGGKRREAPPQMPTRIELTAMDLITGTAHVDVVGTTRPPATRLFIMTDQSGRRFVPSFAECHPPPGVNLPAPAPGAPSEGEGDDEPADSGPELPTTTRWRCSITIPRLYRRAPLTSMGMEWGNLYVAAPSETVQRLWGEARAAAPLSAIAERHATAPAAPIEPPVRKNPLSIPELDDPPLDDDPSDVKDTIPAAGKTEHAPVPTE